MCSTRRCYEQQYQQTQERPFKDAFKIDKSQLQITVLVVMLSLIAVAFWVYEVQK